EATRSHRRRHAGIPNQDFHSVLAHRYAAVVIATVFSFTYLGNRCRSGSAIDRDVSNLAVFDGSILQRDTSLHNGACQSVAVAATSGDPQRNTNQRNDRFAKRLHRWPRGNRKRSRWEI